MKYTVTVDLELNMHPAPDQQVMNDAYDHALWLRRLESPLDTRDRQLCDLGHYVSQLLNALADLKAENAKLRDPEAIIKACVPGGQICDPQQVADAIRDYFKR